jgi:hypothetical protein
MDGTDGIVAMVGMVGTDGLVTRCGLHIFRVSMLAW